MTDGSEELLRNLYNKLEQKMFDKAKNQSFSIKCNTSSPK